MSNKVTANKIYQKDIFDNFVKSADEAILKLKELSDVQEKRISAFSEMAKKVDLNSEGLLKLSQLEKKQTTALTEKEKLDRKIIKLEERRAEITEDQRIQLAKLRTEEQKSNRGAKQAAILVSKETTQRQKLNTQIKILSDRYREIIADKKKETAESKKLLAQILALKKSRDRANESLGNHQAKVGQYERSINKLSGSLARLGLSFGVFEILRSSFDTLTSYEEKIADIQKTTNLAADQVRLISVELASIDTRTSIENLQDLAVAAGRLGIEGENITGFVEAADKVFVALGDDLSGSADQIANSIGKISANFGLEEQFGVAEGIERVASTMNELAANSKAGAGAIFDFTQRMTGVASVAGIAQEDIQALGALFDSTGQSIEVAATTLNKLIPALATDQARFAEVAGLTAEEFSNLLKNSPVEALKAVAVGAQSSEEGLEGLVETLGDFGVESSRAIGIVGVLAENTEELTRLQDLASQAFQNNTSITEEFNTKNQTLGAELEKLKNTWKEFLIDLNEGAGIGNKLKTIVIFLRKNLSQLIKVVVTGVKAFVSYRVALKLYRTEIDETGKSVATGLIPNIIKMGKSLFAQIKNIKAASFSLKGLKTAIQSIPFAGFVSFLVTVGPMIWDFAKGLFTSAEEMSALGEATEKANKEILEEKSNLQSLFEQLKRTNSGTEERADLIDRINSEYGTTLQNLEDETEFASQLEKVYDRLNRQLERRIKTQIFEEEAEELIKGQLKLEKALAQVRAGEEVTDSDLLGLNSFSAEGAEEFLLEALDEAKRQKEEIFDAISDLRGETRGRGTGSLPGERGPASNNTNTPGGGPSGANLPSAEKRKLQELAEFKKQQETILKEFENDLIKDGVDRELTDQLVAEKRIKLERETGEKIIELNFDSNSVLIDFENKRLKHVRDNETERIEIVKDANEEIQKEFDKVKEEFDSEGGTAEERRKKIAKEIVELLDSLQEPIKEAKEALKSYYDFQKKKIEEQRDLQRDVYDESRDRENELRDIARERNLDATESIKAEREIQKEALEKERELKRKELEMQALIAGLNALGNGESVSDITKKFISLKKLVKGSFYKGTKTTLGDELGYTGKKDAHLIYADENEAILNPQQTAALGIGTVRTTDELVDMVTNPMFNTLISPVPIRSREQFDPEMKGLLRKVVSNTKPEKQPSLFTVVDDLTGQIVLTEKRGTVKQKRKYIR